MICGETMDNSGKNKWYWRYTHYFCPVCCSERTDRDRVYDIEKRGHFYIQHYDWCDG